MLDDGQLRIIEVRWTIEINFVILVTRWRSSDWEYDNHKLIEMECLMLVINKHRKMINDKYLKSHNDGQLALFFSIQKSRVTKGEEH